MATMEIDAYVLTKQALQSALTEFTQNNVHSILGSPRCVCFACRSKCTPFDIIAWETREGRKSAVCPRCGNVAVAGYVSWVVLTDSLIDAMHEYWLEAQCLPSDFDWSIFSSMS